MRLALILLCGQAWAQSIPAKPFALSDINVSSPGNLTVVSGAGKNLLTCTEDEHQKGIIKTCTLSEGVTLEEVMQIMIDVQSACYTREGKVVHPNRGDSMDDCMYNGASFKDWDKRANVLESAKRTCRKNKGQGEALYFDPFLRKKLSMSCSVLLSSK